MKAKIKNYLDEVKAELAKVSWPDRNQLKATTVVIILLMAVMGMFVGVIDVVFSKLVSIVLR